ncbi:hypothetical protein DE146DRAFT_16841 [Phaeosphaeria sp. MPI-PUGE-AT-0046c]|nr:hypothetical protein DE146DRAFT_16841 [Phaeosphaeria sp. MPI-PUGE-AT-0046c]
MPIRCHGRRRMHVLGVCLIGLSRRSYQVHTSDGPTVEVKPQATTARNSVPLTPDSRRSIQTANEVQAPPHPDPNTPSYTHFCRPRNSHRSGLLRTLPMWLVRCCLSQTRRTRVMESSNQQDSLLFVETVSLLNAHTRCS